MSRIKSVAASSGALASSLGFLLGVTACLGAPPVTAPFSRISLSEGALITQLAASRPCAALALLYVRAHASGATHGMFYLEELPSSQNIAFIVSQNEVSTLDLPLQPNLYSGVRIFVEVKWDVEKNGDASDIVTTSAQLVYASGAPLTPAHPVEIPTQVLLAGGTLRVLGPQTAL